MILRVRRDTVPIVLVGVGVRGRMWARVLAAEPGVRVVGYIDPDPAARAWVRETFGPEAPCFTDSTEALQAVDAALAVVATPPMERLPLCVTLLDAGCDLLVEKPLTIDIADAVAVADYAERKGRRCFVAMNFRYAATTTAARRLLSRGDLGPPGMAHITYWRNRNGEARGLNKYPLTMDQPLLWEQSVHHLDLVRFVYNTEVAAVTAMTSNPPWSMYAGDATVCATLTLTNGMTVQYTGTWAARTAHDRFHWRTDCAHGALIQTALFDGLHIVHDGTEAMEFIPLPFLEPFVDDMRALFRAVLHDLHTGDHCAPAVRDHIQTLAVTTSIEQSAATGMRVTLNGSRFVVRSSEFEEDDCTRTQHAALSTQHS
jgi:predicted dehydrogenase